MTLPPLLARLRAHTNPGAQTSELGYSLPALMVILPLLFFAIIGTIQAGLWYTARSVAIAASEEGARAMSAQQATQEAGCTAAQNFAARANKGVLDVTSITCTRGADATVTIRGKAPSLVPLLPIAVNQSATLPVERVS